MAGSSPAMTGREGGGDPVAVAVVVAVAVAVDVNAHADSNALASLNAVVCIYALAAAPGTYVATLSLGGDFRVW